MNKTDLTTLLNIGSILMQNNKHKADHRRLWNNCKTHLLPIGMTADCTYEATGLINPGC